MYHPEAMLTVAHRREEELVREAQTCGVPQEPDAQRPRWGRVVIGLLLAVLVALASVRLAVAGPGPDLAAVRRATAQYHRPEAAMAAGWNLVPGLDHCFFQPGVGAMGYHLIDAASLDLSLDPLHPEALVYAPGPNGQLQLGAVEYVVPAAAWDATGNPELPMVLGQRLHLNEALGVYILHAWIWKHNPSGIFEDWNPRVHCSG
jgi:hypothetical protein